MLSLNPTETFPGGVPTKLSATIDAKNLSFTNSMKSRLKALEKFADADLEWLMVEHYQFSARNPAFLATAASNTETLEDKAIALELHRNFNEEKSHAAMYRRALKDVGVDVEARVEFAPTSEFFEKVQGLLTGSPDCTVGAMYATETAAIFEHEVFWEISREVARRRGVTWEGSRLKHFHDMHLDGVEQSHKDGLADFVDRNPPGSKERADTSLGAIEAIEAMVRWWNALLAHL